MPDAMCVSKTNQHNVFDQSSVKTYGDMVCSIRQSVDTLHGQIYRLLCTAKIVVQIDRHYFFRVAKQTKPACFLFYRLVQ